MRAWGLIASCWLIAACTGTVGDAVTPMRGAAAGPVRGNVDAAGMGADGAAPIADAGPRPGDAAVEGADAAARSDGAATPDEDAAVLPAEDAAMPAEDAAMPAEDAAVVIADADVAPDARLDPPDADAPDSGIRDARVRPDAAPTFPDAAPTFPDAAPTFPDAAPRDAGVPDAGARDAGVSLDAGVPSACIDARLLFRDDFELGTYARWSSGTYDQDPSPCNATGITNTRAHEGTLSSRGVVTCAKADLQSHRAYGGVQFNGDNPRPVFTNTGAGIDAPFGVIVTFWGWLDAPNDFGNGRWFSHFTVNGSCDWSDPVITLGVSNTQHTIDCAHIPSNGGILTYAPNQPTMPLRQWVRTTIYLNYIAGEITTWMDGRKVFDGAFARRIRTMCQFHFGLYASPTNSNITYFEDDISIHRLESALPNRVDEPWVGGAAPLCP